MKFLLLLIPVLALAQQPPAPAKPKAPPPIPPMVDEKYGTPAQIMALPPAKLIAILKDPKASVYAKAKSCQRLAVVGDKSAVPALAALLTNPQLSYYARFGLEPIPDPAADQALRAALGQVKGRLLAGVINSIGHRRDAKAIPALAPLVHHPDREVAQAAAAALARIRPPL
jgi:HEAT repeat protein